VTVPFRLARIAARGFRALLAGLVLLGTRAPAADGRYLIVRTDGSVMTLAAAPEQKGNSLVGRLAQSNQLVSFPAAEVDSTRTLEANRPVPTPAPKGRPPILTRETPVPTESRLLKVPREEAERSLAATSGTAPRSPVPERPGAAAPTGETAGAAGAVDRNGHGEAWWRRKAAPVRSRLSRAEADLQNAVAARDAHERTAGRGTPAWQVRLHRLNQSVEKAQTRLGGEQKAMDRLSDDARKAGAYPGWLR
jgi:hypothetical protein